MTSYDELTMIRLQLGRWHPDAPHQKTATPLVCNKNTHNQFQLRAKVSKLLRSGSQLRLSRFRKAAP